MKNNIYKISILLLLISLLCGCKKETIDYQQSSVYKLGKLSFEMIDYLKKQSIKDKNQMIFSIVDDKEDITVTVIRKKNIESSLENFIKGFEEWSPNIDNMEEITIHNHEWLKEKKDEITWITKYNKDIYAIKVSHLRDEESVINYVEEKIENTLRFQ